MNRTILSTLVLPSVLACTAVGSAVEPKPMNSPVLLLAEGKQPAGVTAVALASSGSSPSLAAANGATGSPHAAVKEAIHAVFTGQDFVEAVLRQGGTLEFAMKGNAPISAQPPKVTKAVEVDLTAADLAQAGASATVTLQAIVDENGMPRNVHVTRSTGAPAVDQKAVAAVTQYRFKPATIDDQPTWSGVSVTIKIQK